MKEHIQELEEQLEEMSKQKKFFIYFCIVILSVYMSWNLFGENMNLEILSKEESIASLESKLQKNSIKSLENAIKKAKQEDLVLDDKITKLNFKNQFIRTKLESMNFIFFDQKGIAQILDDILKQSLKRYIDIDFIDYEDSNISSSLHVIEKEQIKIEGSASYKNLIKLIQYIDNINSLLQINSISVYIDEDTKTKFSLNISHFGVEL